MIRTTGLPLLIVVYINVVTSAYFLHRSIQYESSGNVNITLVLRPKTNEGLIAYMVLQQKHIMESLLIDWVVNEFIIQYNNDVTNSVTVEKFCNCFSCNMSIVTFEILYNGNELLIYCKLNTQDESIKPMKISRRFLNVSGHKPSRFPGPQQLNLEKSRLSIWIGNVGPFNDDRNVFYVRRRPQLTGCLDTFCLNGNVVDLESDNKYNHSSPVYVCNNSNESTEKPVNHNLCNQTLSLKKTSVCIKGIRVKSNQTTQYLNLVESTDQMLRIFHESVVQNVSSGSSPIILEDKKGNILNVNQTFLRNLHCLDILLNEFFVVLMTSMDYFKIKCDQPKCRYVTCSDSVSKIDEVEVEVKNCGQEIFEQKCFYSKLYYANGPETLEAHMIASSKCVCEWNLSDDKSVIIYVFIVTTVLVFIIFLMCTFLVCKSFTNHGTRKTDEKSKNVLRKQSMQSNRYEYQSGKYDEYDESEDYGNKYVLPSNSETISDVECVMSTFPLPNDVDCKNLNENDIDYTHMSSYYAEMSPVLTHKCDVTGNSNGSQLDKIQENAEDAYVLVSKTLTIDRRNVPLPNLPQI